jgi:tRNA (cmo5U34)-methyltransferase
MNNQDKIYRHPLDKIADFAFDENVAAVFPDMIQRSVPGYSTIIAMTGLLAARYATQHSRCYDLGCSLGASTLAIASELGKHPEYGDVPIVGIDNSAAMLERCRSATQQFRNIELRCENIEASVIANASVVVMNFTLQFVAKENRHNLLQKIYDGMVPGGILVLSEKIRFADAHLDQLNIELHHEFKKANGYSDLEISQKRSALENVLVPETLETHEKRLKTAGFKHCDVWFQCFNFASLVAIK